MKIAIRTIQILVAILFIVSGLVKANDPLGLGYKMEEFFIVWSEDLKGNNFFTGLFNYLNDRKLFLSIVMIALEIVAGVALLVGWKKKLVLYLLLVLIVFFSFLTGYAFYAKYPNGLPKFTNCGCFGDCLPITPLTSFIKDLLLLGLIIFLIICQRYLQLLFSKTFRIITVSSSLAISLLLQWYVLKYLPLADCLPMKKGNNIMQQMKPAKNSVPSVYETRLVYENISTKELKDMSQDEFNNSKIWEDGNWKWKATNTKLIRQGTDIPKLPNFSLTTFSGVDSTREIIDDDGCAILYFVNPDYHSSKQIDHKFWEHAISKMPVYFITSAPGNFIPGITTDGRYKVFTCDGTVFRIAARVNPTIYLIKQGTIIHKWPLAKLAGATKIINN